MRLTWSQPSIALKILIQIWYFSWSFLHWFQKFLLEDLTHWIWICKAVDLQSGISESLLQNINLRWRWLWTPQMAQDSRSYNFPIRFWKSFQKVSKNKRIKDWFLEHLGIDSSLCTVYLMADLEETIEEGEQRAVTQWTLETSLKQQSRMERLWNWVESFL